VEKWELEAVWIIDRHGKQHQAVWVPSGGIGDTVGECDPISFRAHIPCNYAFLSCPLQAASILLPSLTIHKEDWYKDPPGIAVLGLKVQTLDLRSKYGRVRKRKEYEVIMSHIISSLKSRRSRFAV